MDVTHVTQGPSVRGEGREAITPLTGGWVEVRPQIPEVVFSPQRGARLLEPKRTVVQFGTFTRRYWFSLDVTKPRRAWTEGAGSPGRLTAGAELLPSRRRGGTAGGRAQRCRRDALLPGHGWPGPHHGLRGHEGAAP